MNIDLFRLFSGTENFESIIEYLDKAEYDEVIEIDVPNNRFMILEHAAGKYAYPDKEMTHSEMVDFTAANLIHPEDRARFLELANPFTILSRLDKENNHGILSGQYRYRSENGNYRWTEEIIIGGEQYGFLDGIVRIYLFDIQKQKNRRLSLALSGHVNERRDELTGLLKNNSFFEAARDMLAMPGKDELWCFIAINIENMKVFNEWYGRNNGRELLSHVGYVLKWEAMETDGLAGYMGEDDFWLLTVFDRDRIDKLYDTISNMIAKYGNAIGFLPAFGICMCDQDIQIMDAMDQASIAADSVKGKFQNRISIFRPEMRDKTKEDLQMLADFQKALKNHEIYFHLQPQCRMSTGKIVGAESLARWKTSDGTYISPGVFVPVLEHYGFVPELDRFIWKEVCSWLSRCIASGLRPVPVSINVSQIDILSIDVPEYLIGLLEQYNVPHDLLKVEITESAYASDVEQIRKTVLKLRENGFLVLMDDFGSGYSSLNMLNTLPVDIVKLDAQFLHLEDQDIKSIKILETIINMTRMLAIPIIVEGVEREDHVKFLMDQGCRYVQGYHYYPPMSADQFEALISDKSRMDYRGFQFKPNQQIHIREFLDQNIYSDSMLNNIIGPVAFYEWDGHKNVDIVRFNQQFYSLVGDKHFHDRIRGIQNYLFRNDLPVFYTLLDQAEKDRLNGGSNVVGVYRSDGSLGQFIIQAYYLEETEKGKLFYASLTEITEITRLQNQMKLLSRYSSESIVFMRKSGDSWSFEVVVHGLDKLMGMNAEEFEAELNNNTFYERVDQKTRSRLRDITMNSEKKQISFSFPLTITGKNNNIHEIYFKSDYVQDKFSDVEYILTLRVRESDTRAQ